jgi:hypothetical protein
LTCFRNELFNLFLDKDLLTKTSSFPYPLNHLLVILLIQADQLPIAVDKDTRQRQKRAALSGLFGLGLQTNTSAKHKITAKAASRVL